MAADNKLLGQFDLVGIPSAPRGMPQVEVTFDIDANGIVNVSAKDKATAKEQQIRIQASGGLSDDEIDRMVRDAESHAEEDKVRRELVETRNHAEALIHTTEKNIAEHGDKIDPADKGAIEAQIAELREAIASEDADAIKAKMELLGQSAMKLGEAMYAAGPEAGEGPSPMDEPAAGPDAADAGPGAGPGANEQDTVVDADFEEVDDKKDRPSS
jgi:molecular chaperone DnaK